MKMFDDVAESSRRNYLSRWNTVKTLTGQSDTKYILKHPKTLYPLLATPNKNPKTIKNLVTVIMKVFTAEQKQKYRAAYNIWNKYFTELKNQINSEYKNNMAPPNKLENIVTMDDIKNKIAEIKPTAHSSFKSHKGYILLNMFVHILPKRADLGNVKVFMKDGMTAKTNFICLGSDPHLQLNSFKTKKFFKDGIREDLNKELVEILRDSMKRYPREYLFTDRNGKPYNNTAYSKYVIRTFNQLFGRKMGVSIWRHVFISTQIDFNNRSENDVENTAHLMGTSTNQQKNVYKWINIPPTYCPCNKA